MEKPLLRQLDLSTLLFHHISSLALVCASIHTHTHTHTCTQVKWTHAGGLSAICLSVHNMLLSINKHIYVSGLQGKHSMYVSWVLFLFHKPGIVQLHTNLTLFTPLGSEQWAGNPQIGCTLIFCIKKLQTSNFYNWWICYFLSFHCIIEFYRGQFVFSQLYMISV